MNPFLSLSMALLIIGLILVIRFLSARREEISNSEDPPAPPTVEEQAAAEIAAMTPTATPKGIKDEDIAAKVAVGLTRDQAIEVLKRQAEEDAAVAKTAKVRK